jgi:peptidyl-prolyl cis-trans isomerase C
MTFVLPTPFRPALLAALVALPCLLPFAAAAEDTAPAAPKPLATVNGEPITDEQVKIAEEDLGSSFAGMTDEQRREAVLNLLIDIRLGSAAAQKAALSESATFKQRLAYLRDKALMQEYMETEGAKAVSEDAVKKLYDETVKDLKPETEVRARHILVPTENEAKKAIERLDKGEDFATVAKDLSKDPGSGQQGGDLGFFTREQMVPEFSEAAFKMEPGAVSKPVKSSFGWHVIKVEEKRERPVPTLDQVRDQITLYLTRKKQQDLIKSLREDAKIVRNEPAPAPEKGEPEAPAPAKPQPKEEPKPKGKVEHKNGHK